MSTVPINTCVWLFVAIAGNLGAAVQTQAGTASSNLPRYRLNPGQELTYRLESTDRSADGKTGFTSELTANCWVTRLNENGGWHMIMLQSTSMSQIYDGKPLPRGEPDVAVFAFDLYPDGRLEQDASAGPRAHPGMFFPALPAAQVAKGSWSRAESMGRTARYQLAPATRPGECVFRATYDDPLKEIYLTTQEIVYHFDANRGLVTEAQISSSQDYGFHTKGTGTIQLVDVQQQDKTQADLLASDAAIYFQATKAYEAAVEAATENPATLEQALADAGAALKAAADKVKLPAIRRPLDDMLKRQDQRIRYELENARDRAAVLDKPAPDWTTTDLSGKTHSLKDYRGKILVMDFWYRGCGWCMYAMPQVKQLAAHFKDKPVVVLGMNTDQDENDARLVVEKMGLTYPTLKAGGLPEQYKVRGFPTLIVVDGQGLVRDVHLGYSPHLYDEVSRKIESLLKEPARPRRTPEAPASGSSGAPSSLPARPPASASQAEAEDDQASQAGSIAEQEDQQGGQVGRGL